MSDLYLDLKSVPRVIDFFVEYLAFSSGSAKSAAEGMIQSYQNGTVFSLGVLAEGAQQFAVAVWPVRYAVNQFFVTEGRDQEWQRVISAVRPTTAHLLERFREAHGLASLDAVFAHTEADWAIREEEYREITEVRHHARQEYWQTHPEIFSAFRAKGERLIKRYLGQLKILRDLAFDLPSTLQDEAFSKLVHYEDRIFFEGECVPFEILQKEIVYYQEQQATPLC